MNVRIQKREDPFVMVDKSAVNDTRLSWKAKGILVYLLSKPDNWSAKIYDIERMAKDGKDSVKSGLKELKLFGYAELSYKRTDGGLLDGSEWIIHETPINTDVTIGTHREATFPESREKPSVGKTECRENRVSDFPLHNNTDSIEKEKNKNNNNSIQQSNSNSSFSSSQKYIEPVHPTDIGELTKKLNAIITKQKSKGSELWSEYFKAGKARKISELCEQMYAAGFVYEHDGGLKAYAERLMKGVAEEVGRVEAEKEELEHEPVAKRCLEIMKTDRFKDVIVNKHDQNKLLLWIDEMRNRKEWGYDFTGDGAMFCLFEHIMLAYTNEDMPEGFKRTLGHALKWWCQNPERKNEIQSNAGTYYGEEGKDADEWWSWTDEMRENVLHVERWVNKNRKAAPLYSSSLEAYVKIGRWILKMKAEGHTKAYLILTKSALEVGRPSQRMTEIEDIEKHYRANKERIDREVYGDGAE